MLADASAARRRARPLLPLRVLIVEDEVGARTALELLLSDLSFTCEVAENGASALEKHFVRPFDLILSDWVMPNGDGMELCRLVREMDGTERYTFFMLLTAHGDKQHLIEGLRGGADAFIRKPLDFDELEAHLVAAERVIRLHRRLAAKPRCFGKARGLMPGPALRGAALAPAAGMTPATMDKIYGDFAAMYADSKAIRWEAELDAAIQAAGLDYARVTREWLASLNRDWVYNESEDPFRDPTANSAYRRLLRA